MKENSSMDLDNAVLTALRRLIRAADLDAKDLARQTGLTTSQLLVLEQLQTTGEMTVGELARAVGVAQGTMTNLIDRLAGRDLLAKRRGIQDRRRVNVGLTAQGQALLAAAPTPLQTRFLECFAQLQDWEQTAILSSLQRLADLMGVEKLDASPVLDVGKIDRPST